MLIDEIKSNPLTIFIASNQLELTYKSVMSCYLAMHKHNHPYPTYLLDIDCDTTRLVNPPTSVQLEEIKNLDLTDPNKVFVIVCSPLTGPQLARLRQSFGLLASLTANEIKELELTHANNTVYSSAEVYNKRFRAYGTGSLVYLIDMVENVFELSNQFSCIQELCQYDFAGFLVRGVANTTAFKMLTSHTNIASKPISSIQGATILGLKAEPKQLLVCYSATMIRFMAIENIKYFFKMQAPELFSKIHFQNLAEMDISNTTPYLSKSFAFICLDMAQEYPILMPEAMLAGNVILGFNGTFDQESDLDATITDFSPECDYRDIANKLVAYAQVYEQQLAQDPNYLHPLAQHGINHAQINYGLAGQIEAYENMLTKLGVLTHG